MIGLCRLCLTPPGFELQDSHFLSAGIVRQGSWHRPSAKHPHTTHVLSTATIHYPHHPHYGLTVFSVRKLLGRNCVLSRQSADETFLRSRRAAQGSISGVCEESVLALPSPMPAPATCCCSDLIHLPLGVV
jgi:hypothetical protein